jgi:hypothetical protein
MKRPTQILAIVLVCAAAALTSPLAWADLFVDITEVTVESNGANPTSGILDVRLGVTGDAPLISAYSLRISSTDPAVTFGTPTPVMTNSLFGAGDGNYTDMSSASTVLILRDLASASTPYVLAFDAAGLIRVPFSVSAGALGTFSLNLLELNSEFVSSAGDPIAFTPGNGSITVIAAVPEAAAWKLLAGAGALAIAMSIVVQRLRSRADELPGPTC